MQSAYVNSLPRRLVGLYLVVSLASLLLVVGLSLYFAALGRLEELASAVVIIPLLLVLIGTVFIKRAVTFHVEIEDQLKQIAAISPLDRSQLKYVQNPNPIGIGWNTIVDLLSGSSALEKIEAHLEAKSNGFDQSELLRYLDVFPEGIAITSNSGDLEIMNRSLKSLLELNETSTSAEQNLIKVLVSIAPDQAEQTRKQLFSATRPSLFELELGQKTEDGILRIARYPIHASQTKAAKFFWSIRDITQQKLAEETRNQFVATATHELRTPLTNIKAYAETLADFEDIEPQQQREFYNIINSEATRLSRFIDDLLNVSQMESGALSLARHETDVKRLAEEVLEQIQPEAKRKQIEIEEVIPVKIPKLKVDKDKITAALVNLLGNAVKYTPDEGHVRFKIETDAKEIHFHVEDTGMGISESEVDKVFEKFYRSDDRRVRSLTGSGLGLSYTQEVARLHGGRVAVDSELNVGSRFTLSLPFNPDQDMM